MSLCLPEGPRGGLSRGKSGLLGVNQESSSTHNCVCNSKAHPSPICASAALLVVRARPSRQSIYGLDMSLPLVSHLVHEASQMIHSTLPQDPQFFRGGAKCSGHLAQVTQLVKDQAEPRSLWGAGSGQKHEALPRQAQQIGGKNVRAPGNNAPINRVIARQYWGGGWRGEPDVPRPAHVFSCQ